MGRFGLLGVVSFGLNLALTVLLHEGFGWSAEAAFALALATVLGVNFVACRYLVFDAKAGDAGWQLLQFLVSSLVFRTTEYLLFLVLHSLAGVYYVAAAAGVLLGSAMIKFFYYRAFVFRA